MLYKIFCLYLINICFANIINYDLLVSDLLFYNQILVFSFSWYLHDNYTKSTDILKLIENLMAPRKISYIINEKKLQMNTS